MKFQSRENQDSGHRIARWDSDPQGAYINLSRSTPDEDTPGVTTYELSLGLRKDSQLRQPPVFVMYDRWLHTYVLDDLMSAFKPEFRGQITAHTRFELERVARMYGGWIIPYVAKSNEYRKESSRLVSALNGHAVLRSLWCCLIDYRAVINRLKLKESGYEL